MNKTMTAQTLAETINGELIGSGEITLTGVGTLSEAGKSDVSFLANKKYQKLVDESKAGVVIVGKDCSINEKAEQAIIICDDPNAAFSVAIQFFAPEPPPYPREVHPAAVVAENAEIGDNTHIGPCVVIEPGAKVGDGSVVMAGTYIGHDCEIGDNCLIYANVSIRERCLVGDRVIIHSGTTIGSDGFGFIPGPRGAIKIPQTGIVQIDSDVEIGANCAIDRARFGRTWIKMGVKIDNQVHIAHNVIVGECSMLIGQSGIAGSAELGMGVILGAGGGINGHIKVGDGVKVAATSAVAKSVPPGVTMAGTPAETRREFMDRYTLPKKFKKLQAKIKDLEIEISKLKNS